MQEVREHILHCERILLHVLGFDFQVDHPHAYIMRFVRFFDTAKRDKESRALVLSSADDRFTEFGVLVRKNTPFFHFQCVLIDSIPDFDNCKCDGK
jgi:hypothetical protein